MNKSQFIERLAAQFDGNRKAASEALDAVLDTIAREVARGEKVAITGFGAFEKALRPARMVRNPRTGERVRAKKTSVPRFRAGAELKAVVSGARKPPKVAAVTVASVAAKKSTAKKATTTKSAAKRSTTKKATAKKTTARKSPAKKTTARKSTAKKSTAKKAPARKTAAKKAPARKTAKKTTARKTAKKS